MADSKRKKFIVPGNRLRQMQQDLRERKGAYTRQIGKNTFEVNPKKYDEKGNLRKTDPNFIMKRQPKIMDPNFEMKREPKNIDPNFIMKDKGFDFPMSREGSPTVTDTETGETTYGRPKDFNKGGMMECRGGGIAITGKKFQGVF